MLRLAPALHPVASLLAYSLSFLAGAPLQGRVYCMAGSSAGRVLATCGEDCYARLWDTERGTFKASMPRIALHFAGNMETAMLVRHKAQRAHHSAPTASTRLQGPLQGHKVPIRWAAFSEDGRQLVTASPDRTVLLWDVPSLSLIRTVPGGPRCAVVLLVCNAAVHSAK